MNKGNLCNSPVDIFRIWLSVQRYFSLLNLQASPQQLLRHERDPSAEGGKGLRLKLWENKHEPSLVYTR